MPAQRWKHQCRYRTVWLATFEPCTTCGAEGRYDGWMLRMEETMAVYQYVYGLLPIGPHRPLADRVFSRKRDQCEQCRGRGIITVEDGNTWRLCAACEGTGGLWNCSTKDVEAARSEVIEAFPASAVDRTPSNFFSPGMTLHVATGRAVDLLRESDEEERPSGHVAIEERDAAATAGPLSRPVPPRSCWASWQTRRRQGEPQPFTCVTLRCLELTRNRTSLPRRPSCSMMRGADFPGTDGPP